MVASTNVLSQWMAHNKMLCDCWPFMPIKQVDLTAMVRANLVNPEIFFSNCVPSTTEATFVTETF